MNWKKTVSGILAAAMVVTSVAPGTAMAAVTNDKTADTSLIAHYAFDGDLKDSVSGKSATLTGSLAQSAATATSAEFTEVSSTDKAIKFSGADSYGILLDAASVPTDETFTISYRAKVNASTAYTAQVFMADVLDDGEDGDLNFEIADGSTVNAHARLALGRGWKTEGDYMCWSNSGTDSWGDDIASGTNVQKTGEWAVLTTVFNGSNVSFYKNGSLLNTSSNLKWINDGTAAIFLGVNYWDTAFEGEISDLLIYDDALTATEVAGVYASQSNIDEIVTNVGVKTSVADGVSLTDLVAGSDPVEITAVLPDGVTAEDVTITFESDSDDIKVTQDAVDKTKATIAVPASGIAEGNITVTISTGTAQNYVKVPVYVLSADPEENFAAKGFEAPATLSVKKGATSNYALTLNDGVTSTNIAEGYPKYEIEDSSVATVEGSGLSATVKGVKGGSTILTATVKVGSTEKSKQTTVNIVDDERLIAEYSFDSEDLTNSAGDSQAKAIVTGLGTYSGALAYADGKFGKAIKLGDYGLEMDVDNLGKNFTVSAWFKADGTIAENKQVLFLGYHSPENWMGIAGNKGTTECKFWAQGGTFSTWTTLCTPLISTSWQNITLVGTDGKIEVYRNGLSLGQFDSNDPLDGTNQDIYFGVNYWDPEFTGLVDDIKVYNAALSAEEVSNLYPEFLEELNTTVDAELTEEAILGINESKDAVKYDLALPATIGTAEVTWESDNTEVIDNSGAIVKAADATVELTATVTAGALQTTRTFTVTTVALSQELTAELAELIEQAEAVDTTYWTDLSKDNLTEALEEGKAAKTYGAVEKAITALTKALSGDEIAEYADPFAFITAPAPTKTMKVGESAQLIVIPVAVQDYVDVEYITSDETTVTNVAGKATAKKAGKATVTAIVTAKADGYVMEYSVAVDVQAAAVTPVTPAAKPLAVGTAKTVGSATYVVTNATSGKAEVSFKGATTATTTKVTVPSTVTISGVTYTVTSIADNAFKNNKKLKSVTIPSTVVTIGNNAFLKCTNLTKVTIPKGVTTIGKSAFSGCSKLKTISIKSTVLKKVGKSAFKGISKKATIKVPKKQKKAYQKLLKKKGQASTVKIK